MMVCAVLFLFTAFCVILMRDGLDDDEAQALWTVRDYVSMNAAPRDALRALRSNVEQMGSRMGEGDNFPPYILVLDAWVMVVGETPLAARWLSLLLVCLVLALALRIWWNRMGFVLALLFTLIYPATAVSPVPLGILMSVVVIGLLWRWFPRQFGFALRLSFPVIVLGLLFFADLNLQALGSRPDWPDAIKRLQAERSAEETAITVYAPQHPLAHYDRNPKTQVRRWISMDLSWRDFSDAEIVEIVEAMAGAPGVWLIIEENDPLRPVIRDALAENRVVVEDFQAGGMFFEKWR